jgi:FkbM family methyltransferase
MILREFHADKRLALTARLLGGCRPGHFHRLRHLASGPSGLRQPANSKSGRRLRNVPAPDVDTRARNCHLWQHNLENDSLTPHWPMSLRRTINRVMRPLLGYEISKVEFGFHLWPDVITLLAAGETRIVFDVGANEGQSAREFLSLFPGARIFSFEPTPASFARLRQFAADRPLITPVNKALGEKPAKAAFNENAFHQTNSLLAASPQSADYLGPKVVERQKTIEVEVTTLDAFCREASVPRIDLLKLDVQGYELSVLKGARELLAGRNIGCLVLEVTFIPLYENQATFHDLVALLSDHQYDLMGFYNFAHSPQHRLMWCEMVFAPHR